MEERFRTRKQKILEQLSAPDEEYTDASPKCSVDIGIREMINEINRLPSLVTTSSCSGRIAVFLEGDPKPVKNEERDSRATTSAGGKGGGKWLFTSHDPVDVDQFSEQGSIFENFGFDRDIDISFPTSESRPQFIHFKFEPLIENKIWEYFLCTSQNRLDSRVSSDNGLQILHILAASTEQAQHVLNAAMSAGFRESGISGLANSAGQPTPPMVAVRSSGFALDTIIGFRDPSNASCDRPMPMVSKQYLRTLLREANNRFQINEQRKERFRAALLNGADGNSVSARKDIDGFEPADVRRERKRREGLQRRERMFADAQASGCSEMTADEPDYDLDFDLNII